MESTQHTRAGIALVVSSLIFIVLVYTMEKIGIPRSYGIAMSAAFVTVLWAVAVFPGGTTRSARFHHADHAMRPATAMFALTAIVALPFLIIDGGVIMNRQPGFLVVLIVGILSGTAFSALLASRPFRQSGHADIGAYLNSRYNSLLPAQLLAPIVAVALFLVFVPALGTFSELAGWFFALPALTALTAGAGMIALSVILGGTTSVSRLASVTVPVFLIASNAVLFISALQSGGIPIGQLTFGSYGLSPLWDLEDQLQSLQIAPLADILTGTAADIPPSADIQMATALVIALGLAAFPPLLQFHASAYSPDRAARSAANTILLSGFLLLTLFAMLVFTSFGFYQTLLGLSVSEARISAPVLYSWAGHTPPLITLCGALPSSPEALVSACANGGEHIISTSDLAVNGGLLTVASPDLNGFPLALTALLVIAVLLMLASHAASLMLAVSSTLTGAYYTPQRKATGSGRIFWGRLLAALGVLAAALAVSGNWLDGRVAVMLGFSLIAATVLPTLVASLYLPNVGKAGIGSAIGTGLGITLLFFVLGSVGVDLVPDNGDEVRLAFLGLTAPLPASLSGLHGLVAASLVLLAAWLAASLEGNSASDAANGDPA